MKPECSPSPPAVKSRAENSPQSKGHSSIRLMVITAMNKGSLEHGPACANHAHALWIQLFARLWVFVAVTFCQGREAAGSGESCGERFSTAGESSGWSATSGRQEDWGCARGGRVCGGVAAPGSLPVRGHTRVLLKLLPGSCGLLLCARCFPNEEDLSS